MNSKRQALSVLFLLSNSAVILLMPSILPLKKYSAATDIPMSMPPSREAIGVKLSICYEVFRCLKTGDYIMTGSRDAGHLLLPVRVVYLKDAAIHELPTELAVRCGYRRYG